jgi:YidC/Oxa1 family membrane protein insertase
MINLFVQLLLELNKIFFNNLGITIIFIGVLSRAIFHPFLASSMRYSKAMRDLKPRLDDAKKKHKGNAQMSAAEQSRILREAGVSPMAGLVGCLGFIIQLVVFFLLFQSLRRVIASGVDTRFLFWNLARPDMFRIQGIPVALPGVLVLITAVLTFIQSKMVLPATSQPTSASKGKSKNEPDFAEAMASSQGTFAYFMPLLIIFWGVALAAGLILYWLVSTVFGIIQQYYINGAGGLKPWLEKIPLVK